VPTTWSSWWRLSKSICADGGQRGKNWSRSVTRVPPVCKQPMRRVSVGWVWQGLHRVRLKHLRVFFQNLQRSPTPSTSQQRCSLTLICLAIFSPSSQEIQQLTVLSSACLWQVKAMTLPRWLPTRHSFARQRVNRWPSQRHKQALQPIFERKTCPYLIPSFRRSMPYRSSWPISRCSIS